MEIACFFPFIGFNLGTDMQPLALMLGILVFLQNKEKKIYEGKYLVMFAICLGALVAYSMLVVPPFQVVKRIFSYLSILIIPLAVYNMKDYQSNHKFEKRVKIYINIWFFVGMIQTFLYRNFAIFLIPLSRTSDNRGVVGLASEPSFYGYMCCFMLLLTLDFKKHRKIYILNLLVQLLIFAQSTVSLIYVVIFLGCLFIKKYFFKKIILKVKLKKIIQAIFITVGVLICAIVVLNKMENSRLVNLVSSFMSNPLYLIKNDQSIVERMTSMTSSFQNSGMLSAIGDTTIMSGYGGVFYEMGWLSFLLYTPIFKALYKGNKEKFGCVIGITVSICMFSAIQLSSPLFGFYVGYCMRKHRDNFRQEPGINYDIYLISGHIG